MYIRLHHCGIKALAKRTLTIPFTNYGNNGLGIQLYLGTMAGMRTNGETLGLKCAYQCSLKKNLPHRKSPGMVGNLFDQQIKVMGAMGFASVTTLCECLVGKMHVHRDIVRKNGRMALPARNLHGTGRISVQTRAKRRRTMFRCDGGETQRRQVTKEQISTRKI